MGRTGLAAIGGRGGSGATRVSSPAAESMSRELPELEAASVAGRGGRRRAPGGLVGDGAVRVRARERVRGRRARDAVLARLSLLETERRDGGELMLLDRA